MIGFNSASLADSGDKPSHKAGEYELTEDQYAVFLLSLSKLQKIGNP